MPRERMPEIPPPPDPENVIRGRFGQIYDLQEQQAAQRTIAEQEADDRRLKGPRRVNFLRATDRDINQRLFGSQRALLPLGGDESSIPQPVSLRGRSEVVGPQSIEELVRQRDTQLAQMVLNGANDEAKRQVINSYAQEIGRLSDAGLIGVDGRIRSDQIAEAEEIDPLTGEKIEMEKVMIETEYGEREHRIPKSIDQKVKLVRLALTLSERNVEGDGTAGVQQAAKIAQTIIAATQDPRYKQRNHIYKDGHPHDPKNRDNIDTVKEKIRDDQINRLYNEYAARTYLNQTYQAYEKADDAGKVNGALSAMRFEWMNTLFRDVPELKFLLQYYVDHGTEYSEVINEKTGKDYKKKFQQDALAYAVEEDREKKIREQYSDKVLKGEIPPDQIKKLTTADLEWAQNLAERIWQMMGRRGSQDRVSGFLDEEGSKKWGDDPQGGNLVIRKILRWKDWVMYQNAALRPHLELMEGIDLDENDFVTQIADNLNTSPENTAKIEKQNKDIIDAFKAKAWMEMQLVRSKMPAEDRDKEDKVIEWVEKHRPDILEKLGNDKKYKSLVVRIEEKDPTSKEDEDKKIISWQANTLVRNVTYGGIKARNVTAIRDGKEQKITVDASIKAKAVNFEEVDWDKFDFRVFGTNPMAYWSYRNLQQPDAARDALIKGSETFLRMPSDQTIKVAADALSYLSAKQWDQKRNIVIRYLEFLQSDAAKEAFLDKIPNNEDRNRILHESTLALVNSLKLGLPEYQEIREKIIGNQPWAELKLAISYLRPRRTTFNAMNGLFEEIGKAVYKDLKVA